MNWLSKQLNKLARAWGGNLSEAKKEFQEKYKDTLKNSDWGQLDLGDASQPFFDVFKKGNKIKVIAEVPGAKEDEIEVGLFKNEKLKIHAPTEGKDYSTELYLPGKVKDRKRSYYYNNGVLTINLELKEHA